MSSDITDFTTYSHGELRTMVESMNSGDVMSASDPWRRAADTLKQIRTALGSASGDATSTWEGNTSNAFYEKMTTLANSVNNTAAYANDAANTLQMMSEAIDQAKHDMPEEPDFWDKLGNAISDTAQNAVGIQDDSTQIPIKDQRKAAAVAVMQTLANKYRTATPVLKPPARFVIDDPDVQPPDPTASAALSAFVMGSGLGAIGGFASAPDAARVVPRSMAEPVSGPVTAPRSTTAVGATTDAGIRGGIAKPTPKPPQSVAVGAGAPTDAAVRPAVAQPSVPSVQPALTGSGTGLDAAALRAPSSQGGGVGLVGGTAGIGGGTGSGVLPFGPGGAVAYSTSARGKSGGAGFPGEEDPGAFAVGRRGNGSPAAAGAGESVFTGEGEGAAGRLVGGSRRAGGSGAGRRVGGGVVGERDEAELVGRSPGGSRKPFTEGGSGLGARGRLPLESGGKGPEEGMECLPGNGQNLRRKKRREGKRADYLVEDEETWETDGTVNPDVVE
ncbi:hypothetical protein GCM10009665_36810 [Kitasatospora nipponensis]|uniref:PPE domain-containing protein n=1 Tax=Kitasatospora nipponensis TaxID=258049 RepID=A0ABN1WGW6_9ACTN